MVVGAGGLVLVCGGEVAAGWVAVVAAAVGSVKMMGRVWVVVVVVVGAGGGWLG